MRYSIFDSVVNDSLLPFVAVWFLVLWLLNNKENAFDAVSKVEAVHDDGSSNASALAAACILDLSLYYLGEWEWGVDY